MGDVVLLVEDDDTVALVVAAALGAAGFSVHRSGDAATALAAAGANPPDVLVTDLNLPDGDGVALARSCRAVQPGLPVVLISGEYGGGETAPADLPGAACLAKPFRRAALLEAVAVARQPVAGG